MTGDATSRLQISYRHQPVVLSEHYTKYQAELHNYPIKRFDPIERPFDQPPIGLTVLLSFLNQVDKKNRSAINS